MDVISKIIDHLQNAEKYIKIAMFQIHHEDIFTVLNEKLDQGVDVEILTLPYDSIHPKVRDAVERRFKIIGDKGAVLHFCKWNVGDPGRTTMATGRWFSFHGKFIVTDKCAIALSANLIESEELDAMIVFEEDRVKIEEFNEKYSQLLSWFINKDGDYEGNIHRRIIEKIDDDSVFELPENVDEIHKKHWIKHYPIDICPENVEIEEKMYFTPFDCRGRNFFRDIIDEAKEFVYISTESFTDPDFSTFLVSIAQNKTLDFRIIGGAKSQDFSDRIQQMFRDLLAQDIKFRTTDEEIHAKLILTEKYLIISSINLNKINLGFFKTKKFWRENTETIYVCKNNEIIHNAKAKYIEVFDSCYNIEIKLCEKLENIIKTMFKSNFHLRTRKQVKSIFAQFLLQRQIEVRRIMFKIGKITNKLMMRTGASMVTKDDFISALVLYYLSERKHDYDQLKEKIDVLESSINLRLIIYGLQRDKIIEKEDDYYKINLIELIN